MTDGLDWTQPLPPFREDLWEPDLQDGTPSAQQVSPWQQPEPLAVLTPDPPSGRRGWDRRKLYVRGNVILSAIMVVLVAGGIANALEAHKTPASAAGPKHSAGRAAAVGLSAAQQRFVSGMRASRWGTGSSGSASQIAAFGQSVCSDRQHGQSQLSVITAARRTWATSSAMSADAMVRLAEQDICASYLSPETVTYVVRGAPGVAKVTYGPAGSSYNGNVPMRVTRPLGHPEYYSIHAQLHGGGTVTCVLKVDGMPVSTATASGGYGIASCRIGQDPDTNLWENENNG
jgi:hypothetical protein